MEPLSWLVIQMLIIKNNTEASQHYLQTFSNFDLYQHNEQSTRNGKIIDLICTNIPEKMICRNVLSCSSISDHDDPYMVTNIPSTNISNVLKTSEFWKTSKWTKLYLISSKSLYKVVRWTLFPVLKMLIDSLTVVNVFSCVIIYFILHTLYNFQKRH